MFLGTFVKWRKSTIGVIMSARLSICPHGTPRLPLDGFSWNFIFGILRRSVEKIQDPLKSDKNKGHVTWRPICSYDIVSIILKIKKIFRTDFVDKIEMHIWCSITYFFKSCHLWNYVETCLRIGQAIDDNIAGRMRFACWITNATNTLSEYVILIAFPR